MLHSGRGLPWLLAGVLVGTAVQLAQPALWAWGGYAALIALGLLLCLVPWRVGLLAGAAMVVFGLCGLRAAAFQSQALDAALEGRDLRVTGMVAAMPQTVDSAFGQGPGQRFRFEVESAPPGVRLPPLLDLAWYASKTTEVPGLHPGQRWDFTVRLKAPHGARNPGGFDYELWLWEQGVQATGTVRAAPARLLAATWNHPIEQARQRVRDAIVQRLAAHDARAAGVVAALVTGDQRAIALEADIKVENWVSL